MWAMPNPDSDTNAYLVSRGPVNGFRVRGVFRRAIRRVEPLFEKSFLLLSGPRFTSNSHASLLTK